MSSFIPTWNPARPVWPDYQDACDVSADVYLEGGYLEGSVRAILVNRYEQSPAARAAAIAHHGTKCVVCDFDFVEKYGELGEGFIHVHHLIELSNIGEDYEIDPQADLVPVCPNCHAMIHRATPATSIADLKKRITPNGRG